MSIQGAKVCFACPECFELASPMACRSCGPWSWMHLSHQIHVDGTHGWDQLPRLFSLVMVHMLPLIISKGCLKEISLGYPTNFNALKIFSISCLNLEVSLDFDAFSLLAKKCTKNMAKLGWKHFTFSSEGINFFSIGFSKSYALDLTLLLSVTIHVESDINSWSCCLDRNVTLRAQLICTISVKKSTWTVLTWAGCMTCFPVNPIRAPSSLWAFRPSKSARCFNRFQSLFSVHPLENG